MQSRGQTNHFESTNVGGYNIVNSEKNVKLQMEGDINQMNQVVGLVIC